MYSWNYVPSWDSMGIFRRSRPHSCGAPIEVLEGRSGPARAENPSGGAGADNATGRVWWPDATVRFHVSFRERAPSLATRWAGPRDAQGPAAPRTKALCKAAAVASRRRSCIYDFT